ncbi:MULTISPECIES: hypothetical protein [Actinomadura]|uniref:hypothetical protein n=1 Tax=Actinomadura TaxID=1988 RepID=UPI002E296A78|nr:hypothetical protein [Actinomadura citrea]
MRSRWVWGGAAITVMAVAGLGVYYAIAGLDEADKLGSVIGSLVAVVGVAVTVYGLAAPPAAGRRVQQRARVIGRGQIAQVAGDQGPHVGPGRGGTGEAGRADGGGRVRQDAQAEGGTIRQVGGDQGRPDRP